MTVTNQNLIKGIKRQLNLGNAFLQSAEENIWTKEGLGDMRLEKAA
jgi:hypothetical protein